MPEPEDRTILSDWSPDSTPELPRIPDIELEGILGQGGMGVVYKGRQPYIDRLVAVKLLMPRPGMDTTKFATRFRREAKLLASLNHRHIVSCYQAGVNESGDCYLAMEFIEGLSLQAWMRKNGPMPAELALEVTAQMAEALGYAAAQGVIHRDVKPDNILLQDVTSASRTATASGQSLPFLAKLVDLGLAMPYDENSSDAATRLTMEGAVVGTPFTMAPEQITDPETVDWRADVYGLGCTLFQMLTGQRAYPQKTLAALAAAKINEAPPDPGLLNSDLPQSVKELVTAMLATKRENRPDYPTIIATCRAIAAGKSAVTALNTKGKQPPPIPGRSPQLSGPKKPTSRATAFSIAAAFLFVASTAAWFLINLGNSDKPATSKQNTAAKPTPSASTSPAPPTPAASTPVAQTPSPSRLEFRAATLPAITFGTPRDITPSIAKGMQGWGSTDGGLQWGVDEDSTRTESLVAAGPKSASGRIRFLERLPESYEVTAELDQLESEAGIRLEFPEGRSVTLVLQTITDTTRLASIRVQDSPTTAARLLSIRNNTTSIKEDLPIRVQVKGTATSLLLGDRVLAGIDGQAPPTGIALHAAGSARLNPNAPAATDDKDTKGTRVVFRKITVAAAKI